MDNSDNSNIKVKSTGKTKSNYIKADLLLPKELLQEIQKYAQGQLIYIPKDKNERQEWGANSGGRKLINERNSEICRHFRNGTAIDALADTYCLSVESIKRIVYNKNNKNNKININEAKEIQYL